MMRLLKLLVIGLLIAVMLWFGTHWYAQSRVRNAFYNAGMSEDASACMGARLTKQLSLYQMSKLTELQHDNPTVDSMVAAVRRIDDPELVQVTAKSALLCSMGLGS